MSEWLGDHRPRESLQFQRCPKDFQEMDRRLRDSGTIVSWHDELVRNYTHSFLALPECSDDEL